MDRVPTLREEDEREAQDPGSDFEKKMKARAKQVEQKAKDQAKSAKRSRSSGSRAGRVEEGKPAVDPKSRDQRIKAMEVQIQQLLGELKALREADDHHEE